jgi:hypothetical protein
MIDRYVNLICFKQSLNISISSVLIFCLLVLQFISIMQIWMIYFDANDSTSWPAIWPEQSCYKTFPVPGRSKVSNSLFSLLASLLPVLKFLVWASVVSLFV